MKHLKNHTKRSIAFKFTISKEWIVAGGFFLLSYTIFSMCPNYEEETKGLEIDQQSEMCGNN